MGIEKTYQIKNLRIWLKDLLRWLSFSNDSQLSPPRMENGIVARKLEVMMLFNLGMGLPSHWEWVLRVLRNFQLDSVPPKKVN